MSSCKESDHPGLESNHTGFGKGRCSVTKNHRYLALSEFESHVEINMGSEKGFGVVFSIVFLVIGLYPLVHGGQVRLWSVVVALILLALAFLAPKTLSLPNRLWFKLGMALGAVVAPIVMALVYFTTVAPIGLIIRLTGKDLLREELEKDANSYWIERDQPVGSMKDQF